jgi:hypothetical protein
MLPGVSYKVKSAMGKVRVSSHSTSFTPEVYKHVEQMWALTAARTTVEVVRRALRVYR